MKAYIKYIFLISSLSVCVVKAEVTSLVNKMVTLTDATSAFMTNFIDVKNKKPYNTHVNICKNIISQIENVLDQVEKELRIERSNSILSNSKIVTHDLITIMKQILVILEKGKTMRGKPNLKAMRIAKDLSPIFQRIKKNEQAYMLRFTNLCKSLEGQGYNALAQEIKRVGNQLFDPPSLSNSAIIAAISIKLAK